MSQCRWTGNSGSMNQTRASQGGYIALCAADCWTFDFMECSIFLANIVGMVNLEHGPP